MIFNYKKILSIFFLIVGLFLLFSYVTIPMMGIGSTFIEIFGWMLSIIGITVFIDLMIKVLKSKKEKKDEYEESDYD